MAKKYVLAFLVGLAIGLFRTFVMLKLWNWFISTNFNLPELSFWTMFGIQLLISFFTERNEFAEERRFERLGIVLNACIPDHLRDSVHEELANQGDTWTELATGLFGRSFGYATTLLVGGIVHAFVQ